MNLAISPSLYRRGVARTVLDVTTRGSDAVSISSVVKWILRFQGMITPDMADLSTCVEKIHKKAEVIVTAAVSLEDDA